MPNPHSVASRTSSGGRGNYARLLLPCLCLLSLMGGCGAAPRGSGAIWQTSTINALLEGVYDGDVTCGEVRRHGDLGLGTFSSLDGEMIVVDGKVLQVRSDGHVYRVLDETTTPLAMVVPFAPTISLRWDEPDALTYERLVARLDEQIAGAKNAPWAVRIEGEFDLVRTRSVPRQSPPYRRLVDIVQQQPTFDLTRVRGTVVGFWFPPYLAQLNVSGYHFHFLDDAGERGGHVLDCRPRRVKVMLQQCNGIDLRLPRTGAFQAAPLGKELLQEVKRVEQEH